MTSTKMDMRFRILAILAVAGMVLCAWLAVFDSKANEQVDAGLKRAVATYATARLLNGVISVVQETGIAVSPAGIGMTFKPGEILDPLNDLVEKFSDVMLVAMVALGVEKVLLTIGASWMSSAILTLVAVAWGILFLRGTDVPRWLAKLLLVLLVTRFAMPVSLVGTDAVFQRFLASDYQESQAVLVSVQGETSKLGAAGTAEKQGIWEQVKSATVDTFAEARARFEQLKAGAEKAVERIIKLMVIFVLETILLPLLFIWGLLWISRGIFERPALRLETGRSRTS